MLVPFVLALQISVTVTSRPDTARPDSARAARDSVRAARDSVRRAMARAKRRIPLTPELLASAYEDGRARDIITRARRARLVQDTSLVSYDAISKQRISAGLGFRSSGRERLVYRSENAARVRWRRGTGVWMDVLGSRTAIPPAFPGARVLEGMMDANAIPYFPGREGLLRFTGVELVTKEDEGLFIHPLVDGAEAYYRYRSGDSVVFRLPDGSHVRLREVEVYARKPRWDLIVGSLWFDAASAQLVRAAYRPSEPFDLMKFIDEDEPDDKPPAAVKALLSPMELRLAAFTVEYGLHHERWWLPRLQTMDGMMRVGFMRIPFGAVETFRFQSVNGTDSLPPIVLSKADSANRRTQVGINIGVGSSGGRDADSLRAARRVRRDSLRRERRARGGDDEDEDVRALDCTPGDTIVRRSLRYEGALPVAIRVPCDTAALAHSPELPASIFDEGDEVFGTAEVKELARKLGFGLQAGWAPQPPAVHYGLERGLLRYNRVEGLSAGVEVEQSFGLGYAGRAMLRLDTADVEPNGEAAVSRSNGTRTLTLGAYRRLNSASDWGNPFGLGASLNALLFARDEGLYYRAWGGELTSASDVGGPLSWRLFAERQRGADVETQFSLAKAINDVRFIDNIRAATGTVGGLAARLSGSRGLDPHGLRLVADARAEAAAGTFDYVRGALDATLSHGLGRRLDGALTLSAGTSGGHVPPQRLWYLGGTQTIRGQRVGSAAGDAFWMARAELGTSTLAARPVVFYDLGWAGSRSTWQHPGTPLSGAGLGLSILDGLIRFDVAKGIRPRRGVRADLYVEARF